MNEDLYKRVMEVIDHLRGTSSDIMAGFIQAIEDDETLTQEEFDRNEVEIFNLVEDQIFQCATCSWVLNVDEMGEDNESGEAQCTSCDDSEFGRG